MARRRGLFKEIAGKHGISISEAKRKFMEIVTTAAKKLVSNPEHPGGEWLIALKKVLPVAYDIAWKKKDFPTVEEILEAVKAGVPA